MRAPGDRRPFGPGSGARAGGSRAGSDGPGTSRADRLDLAAARLAAATNLPRANFVDRL